MIARSSAPPPEVVIDYHHKQVLARREDGSPFVQYLQCPGCGWLIGCGDAIGEAWHLSCAEKDRP